MQSALAVRGRAVWKREEQVVVDADARRPAAAAVDQVRRHHLPLTGVGRHAAAVLAVGSIKAGDDERPTRFPLRADRAVRRDDVGLVAAVYAVGLGGRRALRLA